MHPTEFSVNEIKMTVCVQWLTMPPSGQRIPAGEKTGSHDQLVGLGSFCGTRPRSKPAKKFGKVSCDAGPKIRSRSWRISPQP